MHIISAMLYQQCMSAILHQRYCTVRYNSVRCSGVPIVFIATGGADGIRHRIRHPGPEALPHQQLRHGKRKGEYSKAYCNRFPIYSYNIGISIRAKRNLKVLYGGMDVCRVILPNYDNALFGGRWELKRCHYYLPFVWNNTWLVLMHRALLQCGLLVSAMVYSTGGGHHWRLDSPPRTLVKGKSKEIPPAPHMQTPIVSMSRRRPFNAMTGCI